jgi:hypothetical protein
VSSGRISVILASKESLSLTATVLLPTFHSRRLSHLARQALAMRWPSFWSSPTDEKAEQDLSAQSPSNVSESLVDAVNHSSSTPTPRPSAASSPKFLDWDWRPYAEPQTIVSTIALTSACIGFYKFYRTFLRRIPAAVNINPSFFRKRSVFGQVTSVGDGDNFRIFHTPGGWLVGWGWWRPIPKDKRGLKNNTV